MLPSCNTKYCTILNVINRDRKLIVVIILWLKKNKKQVSLVNYSSRLNETNLLNEGWMKKKKTLTKYNTINNFFLQINQFRANSGSVEGKTCFQGFKIVNGFPIAFN